MNLKNHAINNSNVFIDFLPNRVFAAMKKDVELSVATGVAIFVADGPQKANNHLLKNLLFAYESASC